MCDTITSNNHKLMFALKEEGPFLQMIENNTNVFKSLIGDHCKPLAAMVTILESNGCLLNIYPLVLQGQLYMHPDRKIQYNVDGVEQWCLNIFDKKMKLQQQGNRNNRVVFNCTHGDVVCISNKARGIEEFADGVRLIHGCPKALMELARLLASITIVMDVCFDSKDAKLKVLKLLSSRFTSAVPSDLNSIRLLREAATATTAVAPQSLFLLDDIDSDGIVKDVIDAKATYLLTYCERYECNEKVVKGK